MKKINVFYFISALLVAVMFSMASCTKEGPAGKDGAPGKDGEDGIDGQDGTASCIQCHDNTQVQFAKQIQWAASGHATMGDFERNDAECAACHTSQGFLQRMANGTHEADGKVENPNPPNCYTCHNIHSTYTPADYALTYADPLQLWINDAQIDIGEGNLCANCHQPRIPDPLPVVGGDDVTITSPYWGVHHGPQSGMLTGNGGYEVGSGYGNSAHTTVVTNGCVTCHMAEAYGVQAGGHTLNMTYDYHGHETINTAGCMTCHTDADALATMIEATQADINDKLATLAGVLVQQGVFDSSYNIVTGTMTADQAGAILNYHMVLEDGSEGVHNHKYAATLLQNSIESLQ